MRTPLGVRVGAAIRARREALGWSQARLAEAAGLSPNYVGIVERGEKLPTLDTLETFAKSLSVALATLLAEEGRSSSWEADVAALAGQVAVEHRPLIRALLVAAGKQRKQRAP